MKKSSLLSIASKISDRDILALKSIYDLRCLTAKQIYKLHYSVSVKTNKPVTDTFCKTKINTFLELGLIEKVNFSFKGTEQSCYFLTNCGVDLVRAQYNLPPNVFDSSRKIVKRGYLRPSELKINNRLIPHQIYLNQFFIDFKNLNFDGNYTYKDGKHATHFSHISPDGILTAKNTYFFIETDLSTENRKLLADKWNNYRNFLNSSEFHYMERKIVVLFILENIENAEQRRELVKLTAYEGLADMLGDTFDIYVGTRDYILECLSNKLLHTSIEQSNLPLSTLTETLANNHGIACKPADYICDKVIDGRKFMYLSQMKSLDGLKLFFIDEHYYEPLSTFNKIAYFELTQDLFYNNIAHSVNLLIVAESIESLYKDLSLTNLANLNAFFTTIERLENYSFEEAIFQLDLSGNLYTFNHSLDERIFSHNILKTNLLDT